MIEILVYPADEVNEKIKKLEDVVGQLKKENEWLMRQYLYQIGYGSAKTEGEAKEKLKEVMQQALKEK